MDNDRSRLTLTDLPIGLWVFGLIFSAVGLVVLVAVRGQGWIGGVVFGGIGALILLFGAQALTITLDKIENKMTLQYRALLWWSKKEIPLNEIAAVQVERTLSSSSGSSGSRRRTPVYRVVLVKTDGTVVPLRSSFSSGESGKAEQARKIREFIGVSGVDQTTGGMLQMVGQLGQQIAQRQQAAISGPSGQEHTTNGVRWRLEIQAIGTSPVTRWVSTDYKTSGHFVALTQKASGLGLGSLLGSFLTQQALSMYGFSGSDLPNLGSAQPVPNPDPQLADFFESLTSDPAVARQLLTPGVIRPLVAWARQNPVQQFQAAGRAGPLAVVFSPNGVYVTFLNAAEPALLQAVAQLGSELVRAQGTGGNR